MFLRRRLGRGCGGAWGLGDWGWGCSEEMGGDYSGVRMLSWARVAARLGRWGTLDELCMETITIQGKERAGAGL